MPLDTYLELAPTYQTPGRIHVAKYARNGLVPHAVFESEIAASLNFVGAVRTKQLFHGACPIDAIPSSTISPRTRWRFAAHTGPLLRRIKCKMLLALNDDPVGVLTAAPTVTFALTNADESVTYASGSHSIGLTPAANDTPNEHIDATIQFEGVPADTDVYGRFEEINGGRLISACVYEESLGITAANGYVVPAPVSVNAPIYDARRQRMYELATLLWKRGAAHLFTWTADNQASPVSTSSTSQDLMGGLPGWTVDLRYCRTLSKAKVPCVLAVYGWMESTAGGNIQLREGANVLASITGWTSTPTWKTTTVDLDASLATYLLYFANGGIGRTFNVGAVSLYQYAS